VTPELHVRPYAPADRPALLELMRGVWPGRPDTDQQVQRRWWWRHPEPPLCVVDDSAGRRLVGLCAYMPFTLRARGQELPAAWFVDFYVLPDFQGHGLGKRLTAWVEERFAVTASLSQTEMAYRVFKKLGWHERMPVTMYVNPWPMRGFLPKQADGLRITSSAIDGGFPAAADLDALWSRLRDTYPSIASRSSADLVRRYAPREGRRYQLTSAYRGSDCVGFLIARMVESASDTAPGAQGLIVDYLMGPGDADVFAGLLGVAANWMLDAGAKRIACLSTVPSFERVLRRSGFFSPSTPLIGRAFRHNTKWLTYHSKVDPSLVDPSRWYLTLGDCDLDEVWYQR
jgi:GNAT superfamily N-acetyltransferase